MHLIVSLNEMHNKFVQGLAGFLKSDHQIAFTKFAVLDINL